MILAKGQAWDRDARALTDVRLSSGTYADPETGEPYAAALVDAQESWSVVSEGVPEPVATREAAQLGIAVAAAPPAVLAALYSGHPVELRSAADSSVPWSAATPIQAGTWDGEAFSGDSLSIGVQSALGALLARDLRLSTYAGTGGLEGTAELKGQFKPRTYGYVRNVTPVLVDANDHIYQVSDVRVADILPREGARAIANEEFTLDVDNGRFQLLFTPALEITADVWGWDHHTVALVNPVEVLRRLLDAEGATVDADSFDAASASSADYSFGTYLESPVSLLELVSLMVRSIVMPAGIPVLVEEGGALALRAIGARPASPVDGLGRAARLDLSATPGLFRTGLVRVTHSRNWTVMDDASLIGARDAEPGIAAFASRPEATFEATDDSVEEEAPGRAPVDIETGLDGEEAASVVASRWLKVLRWPWTSAAISTLRVPSGLRAGDAVHLELGAETSTLAAVAGSSSAPITQAGTVLLLIPQDAIPFVDESGDQLVDESGNVLVDDL